MNTFEYGLWNCSYVFSPSLHRFRRGAAVAAAVAVFVFCITRSADAQDCQPDATGAACQPFTCPIAGQICQSTCVDFDPLTGTTTVTQCDCTNTDECHVETAQGTAPALRSAASDPCVISDPGTGTIELPPIGCEYLSPEEVHEIIDANSGATFELAPIHKSFVCNRGDGFPGCPPPGFCEEPGGFYGGNVDCFESFLELDVSIPSLPTFARTLSVPVLVQVETAPRTPGDAVQDFETRMNFVQGELFDDSDFCMFRVTGGNGFGLPSPGHTTLTRLGPPGSDFQVDSFFDITYRIEFQGCPGSQLEGMLGDTTGTIRMETGGVPDCIGGCPPGEVCERTETVDPTNGHIEICCRCVSDVVVCSLPSDPAVDPCSAFQLTDCQGSPNDLCLPRVLQIQPVPPGGVGVAECACVDSTAQGCGPIESLQGGTIVSCPGECAPPDVQPCQIWKDEQDGTGPSATGQVSGSVSQWPVDTLLWCDCAPPCQTDADCDDNNPCTNDVCLADGTCQNTPICATDADCDDLNSCTTDTCRADGCCDNIPDCTVPADCDDGNVCTADTCDPATGCCTNRLECTTDAECADTDPCTTDFCDANGCCQNVPECTVDTDCTDFDICTIDTCVAGCCQHTPDPACSPTEACCLFDGRCIEVSSETCCDLGGVPQGPGTDCTTADCPVTPIWTGMNIDIHQDNPGIVANDFHIEGIVESSRPPVVIDHIDDLFTNYSDTIWQGDPECPTGSIWWCFEADWSGADYPYCTTLHLGLVFEVVCHNVMIDLVGWWTIDGVPVGSGPAYRGLPQAGYWPVLGFDVEDNIRVEPAPEPPDPLGQHIRLRNGNANGIPEGGEIQVEILSMDLVSIGSSGLDGLLGPRPLEELRVGGLQETLQWVPVVDETGSQISPSNPVPMMPEDEIMVLLRPAPGAASGRMRMFNTAEPMDILPGGYLIARQLMRFVGNGPAREEEIHWAWELHGAHNVPLPEACCFEDGTCAELTPSECVCQGGTPQGLGTVCDADGDGTDDACPTGACCLHDGSCLVTIAPDCANQGGAYAGDGTDCTDADLNGIADQCEPDVCEPNADGTACEGPCPSGTGCFGECIGGAYCDDPDCCLIPGQCLCYAPNTKESIKYCGDCFGECVMGSYCDDVNHPECWIVPGAPACYVEFSDISIQLCPDNTCFGECIDGAYCDVDPTCCVMGPGNCACYDPDHWISIKLCGENQPTPPQECHARCVTVDPVTGDRTITACECKGQDECHVDLPSTAVVPGARETGGDPCVVTNASGTVELPPIGCQYLSADEVHEIIDANSGVTFELAPIHKDFVCNRGDGFPGCPPPGFCEEPGGSYGGNVDCFESTLEMQVSSPALPTFAKTLNVPVLVQVETAPRTPGDAVQEFETRMNFVQGDLFGDPDFCVLHITGGDGFGLPSPGHTTLTRLGPPGSDFAVDSFFDITYRIEFEGCPGSQLEGMVGDTTGTIRMVTGSTPDCVGACPPNTECREQRTVNADGTIELCCECVDSCVIATPVDVDYAPAPPDIGFGAKNRYMTFRGGDAGRLQAVQVQFVDLPDFPYANGRTAWVQAPYLVTEASGSNAGAPLPTMWAARLGCTPFYTDWSVYDRVDVFDDGIVPRSRYDVRLIDATCDCMNPADYSATTTVRTSAIGDVVGNGGCAVLPCDAPQGVVDFVDISAVVDKFRNLLKAPRKARADLINSDITNPIPDQKIDFVDISYCVDGFRGTAPLPTGPPMADPCPGPCP